MNWISADHLLAEANTVVIVTHIKPDGDAIGSLLGLANAIRAMGKTVTCAVDEGVPLFLKFLPGAELVRDTLTEGTFDLAIFTDVADDKRAGKVGEYALSHSATVINVDHHPTNPLFGTVALVNPTAVSATEVVFDWWEHRRLSYGREVSLALLTGLVTDTVGFRVSSTSPRTLEIAMYLMQRGASLTEVTARTLESMTGQEFALWKRIMDTAELSHRIASATVTLADAKAVGMTDTTDAGFVQFLVNIDDAMIGVVFKERVNGEVSLSMRAKRGYDVAWVASQLGGGGHIQAAGATIQGTLEEVRARVVPLLRQAVAKGTLTIV